MSKSEKSESQKQSDEWRENAKHMYERSDTISLDWPSLTTQWCLDDTRGSKAMVATYTSASEPEYIREVEVDTDKLRPESHQVRSWDVPPKSEDGENEEHEVQKLRQCPQQPDIFAAFAADSGDVSIYRKSKTNLIARLPGHQVSGYGLAWSPKNALQLCSGSEDGEIILWQSKEGSKSSGAITGKKIAQYNAQTVLNEVTWDHEDHIVLALESGHVQILSADLKSQLDVECHDEGVNTASLSPFAPHLLATGASDKRWRLFDTRRPSNLDPSDVRSGSSYENFAHEGSINCLRWSPHIDGVLATAAMDGVVYSWDIRKIGQDQPHEDVLDGAAELLFKHNGHLKGEQVQEIDWHPKIPSLLLSCDGRNALMSWKPSEEAISEPEVPNMPSFLI